MPWLRNKEACEAIELLPPKEKVAFVESFSPERLVDVLFEQPDAVFGTQSQYIAELVAKTVRMRRKIVNAVAVNVSCEPFRNYWVLVKEL